MNDMICGICGGIVEWRGNYHNLEKTVCTRCGTENPPIVYPIESDDLLEEGEENV